MSFGYKVEDLVAAARNGLVGAAPGWQRVRLGEVAQVVNGAPFKSAFFNADNGEPVIRIRDILPGMAATKYSGPIDGEPYIEHGELVVGMDGDFNSRLWPGDRALINQRVCKVVPDESRYSKRFLAYALPGYLKLINDHTSSVTVKHLSSRTLQEIPLPNPDLNTQEAISDKIDELFSRIDEGERALKTVETLVERYRQSVLKAAVTGELTRDWREAHQQEFGKSIETGEQLLARILKARREAWEKAELEKMIAKGKPPKNDAWKEKYKQPARPREGLSDLPHGWAWATLDQLLLRVDAGKSFRCDERPPDESEVGVVKVSAVSWGEFDSRESKTVTDDRRVNPRYLIDPGDFLISRANTIDLVGACVIAGQFSGRLMLSDKILRLKFHPEIQQLWVIQMLRSQLGREQIEGLSTGNQESMRNIGQQRVRQISIPLPPMDEQLNSIESLERFRSQISQVRDSLVAGDEQTSSLRQSVLSLAFRGGL